MIKFVSDFPMTLVSCLEVQAFQAWNWFLHRNVVVQGLASLVLPDWGRDTMRVDYQ